jgi:hypothetical protein
MSIPDDIVIADQREALAVLAVERDALRSRLTAAEAERDDDRKALRAINAETDRLQARLTAADGLLRDSKRKHRYCEDSWYSCPKSEDGCANENEGTDCNCGADEWNARIDAHLAGAGEARCLVRKVGTDEPLPRCADYPRCPCGGPGGET